MLEPALRAELVDRLSATGVSRIEVTSFVSPQRVPEMAGAEELAGLIERKQGVRYCGLVLNERGYDRLRETPLDEVHVVLAATETFNRRNQGVSVDESLEAAAAVIRRALADGRRVSGTVAVAFGCPFEGAVPERRVFELAERMVECGADEIVLADTIGVGVPRQARRLVRLVRGLGRPVGVHLHNTRNTGIANTIAAADAGATVVDTSIGGIGGCPFAPNATGNVATEDVAYVLEREGLRTGADLDKLIDVATWLEGVLGRTLEGLVYRAGGFPAA